MKTEVKFRELPEKVQDFIERTRASDKELVGSDDVRLSWLHNLPEWNQATDDERLAYAEWRYPIGTVFKGVYDSENQYESSGIFSCNEHSIFDSETNYRVLLKTRNQWAEIVSLPDIKEASLEAQEEFVKANPGMQHAEEPKGVSNFNPDAIRCSNNSKEPKAGDMVEATNSSFMTILTKGRFTGGKSEGGDFIVELGGSFITFKYIRLPQKSEVESKAMQLMKVYDWTVDDIAYFDTLKMLIEICKWGQANPGKI